jgi:hypothetical protein
MEHPEVVHLAAFDHLKLPSIFQLQSSQQRNIRYQPNLPDEFNPKRVSIFACNHKDNIDQPPM